MIRQLWKALLLKSLSRWFFAGEDWRLNLAYILDRCKPTAESVFCCRNLGFPLRDGLFALKNVRVGLSCTYGLSGAPLAGLFAVNPASTNQAAGSTAPVDRVTELTGRVIRLVRYLSELWLATHPDAMRPPRGEHLSRFSKTAMPFLQLKVRPRNLFAAVLLKSKCYLAEAQPFCF